MVRLKRLKKIHIHREGTHTLAISFLILLAINEALYFGFDSRLPFYIVAIVIVGRIREPETEGEA